MNITFGQAKRQLAATSYLRGDGDVGAQINEAVTALAELNGWECLRRLVRFFSATPVIALPQGSAGLTRVCVNGNPASLHATDYQFMHSGPGDLDSFLSRGFRLLRNADVADLGEFPVAELTSEPLFLCAVSDYVTVSKSGGSVRPQPPILVTGTNAKGEKVTRSIPVNQSPTEIANLGPFETEPIFNIERVVLDQSTDEYITLYGLTGSGSVLTMARYHPEVKVPKFHLYRIEGVPGPYDVLAEVRIEPLPCIDDNDVIPLPSLRPVKLMLLSEANLAMNELKTAQEYQQQAMAWLQQMQVADNTLQTPVVQNVLLEGSPGDMTDQFENL